MNRAVKYYFAIGVFLLLLVSVVSLVSIMNTDDTDSIFRTFAILIPIIFAVFFLPMSVYTLKRWDIHFNFMDDKQAFRVTLSNYGDTPFNFNRVSFVSCKRFILFGRRDSWPVEGLFNSIEIHGADSPSVVLHDHTGRTIKMGFPVVMHIRPRNLGEILSHFKGKKIHLRIYFEGAGQAQCSQHIPRNLIKSFVTQPNGVD